MTTKTGYDSREIWLFVIFVLLLLTVLTVWFPLVRSFTRVEINYNEGWNAYRASWVASGERLYGEPPGYILTNYPPISFHVVGLLGRALGDFNMAGRHLSLVSLALIAILIGMIVTRWTGLRRAGIYAGVSFVIWLADLQPDRIGMNDPQLLGMVFGMGGLYAYLRADDSARWLWLSAIAFAFSVFTKNNLLALPLAVGAHLLLTRSFQRLAVWTGTLALLSILILAITWRVDGPYFLAHLTAPRDYTLQHAALRTGIFLKGLQLPAAVAMVWLIINCLHAPRNLLLLAFVLSHALAIAFSGGSGVDGNIFFDSLVVLVVITAVAATDVGAAMQKLRYNKVIYAMILLAPFAGIIGALPNAMFADFAALRKNQALELPYAETVSALNAVPGPVMCVDLLLCFDAGKKDEFELFTASIRIATRKLSPEELLALIDSHHFQAAQLQIKNGQLVSPLPMVEGFDEKLLERYPKVQRNGDWAILTYE